MRRRAVRLSGKRLLVLLIGLMAVGLGSGDGSSANLPGRDWTKYLSEIGGSGFTSETLITPANAAQLRQPAGWPRQLGPSATQPLVANNLVYSGSFDGHEYAVPAVGSGAAGWSTYLGMTNGSCGGAGGIDSTGAITSVTLPGQTSPTSVLFVGGGGNDETGGGQARLYALDALTGAVIWQTPLGPAPATFIWGSPAVYTYVSAGVPTTFGVCRRLLVRRRPLVQGAVVQLDAATGQIEHRFNVVPDGCVGGSVWGSPTIDATDGSLYVATGNHGTCNTDEPSPKLSSS